MSRIDKPLFMDKPISRRDCIGFVKVCVEISACKELSDTIQISFNVTTTLSRLNMIGSMLDAPYAISSVMQPETTLELLQKSCGFQNNILKTKLTLIKSDGCKIKIPNPIDHLKDIYPTVEKKKAIVTDESL